MMPKVVKAMPAKRRMSKWNKYLDGQVWQFTQQDAVDLGIKNLNSVKSSIYNAARLAGLQIAASMQDGCLFITATK